MTSTIPMEEYITAETNFIVEKNYIQSYISKDIKFNPFVEIKIIKRLNPKIFFTFVL